MLDLKKSNIRSNKTSHVLISLRKEYDLTQRDIANRFQVSAQAVSKWERGENLPESRLLLSISRFYELAVNIISMILLSFGVLLILITSLLDDSDKARFNPFQKAIFSISIVLYFLLNYYYDLWEISWTIFVLAYGIGQYKTNTKDFKH